MAASVSSHVQIRHPELGVLLDKLKPRLGLAAQAAFDQILGPVQGDTDQGADGWGFIELGPHYLAQAFEAPDLGRLGLKAAGQQLIVVCVVAGVARLATMAEAVERRQGEEQASTANPRRGVSGRSVGRALATGRTVP